VQILQPFAGSIQQYAQEIADPDRYRPDPCPQCQSQHSLIAHGFYRRTLVDAGFDDAIRVRRYLCRSCKRTVSLLPQFALPYLRFSIPVIAPFLVARLLQGATLAAAAVAAAPVCRALPARPVLDSTLSTAGRCPVRRAGGVDPATARGELYSARSGDVAVRRLGRCPPLPVLRSAVPPVGLAGVSRSRRALRRAPPGGAARPTVPTQLLHGAGDALGLMAGSDRTGFPIPAPRRVLVCQFELPLPQFVTRLATMRRVMGNAADQNLLWIRATGHLLSAPQGLSHFLSAARAAAAEIIVLDPLYSTHDQDENDTRAMAALARACSPARGCPRRADRGAPRTQIHRPLRDRQRFPWLQHPACCWRQLPAADQTVASVSHPRAAFPIPLRRSPTAAPARTRSSLAVVLSRRPGAGNQSHAAQSRTCRYHSGSYQPRWRSALQPNCAADHDAHRVFQTDRATGHCRGLPARLDRHCRWPLPPARVAVRFRLSARGRARADAQGRCDGAGSEEIGYWKPSGTTHPCRRFLLSPRAIQRGFRISPISLVKLPSGGLGLQNAQIAPAAFAGRSK